KAQTMALLSLAMESARAGRFGDTLDWLARPSGRPAGSCVLGVAVDAERQVTAARARDGAVIGRFVARRAAAELVPAELVPAEIARTLATCPTVDVLALPPVEGLPRLLGRDVAWSYRAAPAAVSAAPTPSLRL